MRKRFTADCCQRVVAWLLIGWLGLCLPLSLSAAEEGYFSVRDARTELRDGVYLLDANIDFDLSGEALDALHSGLPLVIKIEIKVEREREWLWKETVAEVRQRYRLQFHALSDRYVVHNLNTDARSSFAELEDALYTIGAVRAFPMLDRRLLDPEAEYIASLRATLDVEELPTPMRLWAYVSEQWRLDSEWYQWSLLP